MTTEERKLVGEVIDIVYTLMGGQGGADLLHLEAAVISNLKEMGYDV